jgi:REP element-mobilizing transposase RayT
MEGMASLTPVGKEILRCWEAIPRHASHVILDAYVVMPNHLHGIICLTDDGRGTPWRAPTDPVREAFGQPRSRSLPTVVRSFKTASTRAALGEDPRLGPRIWQRGYYEHVIRGEEELARIRSYIEENPARWEEDEYFEGDP